MSDRENLGAVLVQSQHPLHSLTLVVVDDHADAVAMLVEHLGVLGAIVLVARSAPEGLKLAEAVWPHAILTDLRLPGADGRWLLRQTRAVPWLAHIPVYAMSDERHDVAAGFNGLFLKPMELDVLVEVLAQLHVAEGA